MIKSQMFYGPAEPDSEQISRARHASGTTIEHMGVDHRGLHIAVTKKLLDRSDVGTALEQVGGEAMAKGVATGRFADPCRLHQVLRKHGHAVFVALPPTNDQLMGGKVEVLNTEP